MASLSGGVRFHFDKKLKPSKEEKNKKLQIKQKTSSFRPTINLSDPECLLDNLLPIGNKGEFIAKHLKRHPFVVRGNEGCLSDVKELLFDLDVAELVQNSASDRIHIWLSQKNSDGVLESISIEDHVQAVKLYRAGHSVYCRAPAELESRVVPRLLNELGLGLAGSGTDKYRRGEIELFLSRKGHKTGKMRSLNVVIKILHVVIAILLEPPSYPMPHLVSLSPEDIDHENCA
jgi:hypothetical protein